MKRILVLFPDEWDRAAALDDRYRGRYEFLFEGFDLFSFPDNARLFTFDALAFVERMVRKYRGRALDGVVTSDEQFGPFLASLIGQRLGLAHTPLAAILTIQHKFYAREAFQRIAPESNPRFGLVRRGFERADEVPMAYPFYIKPAKAAFSVLARRVDSFDELYKHTRFGWFERPIIERLVRPFADVMWAHSQFREDPYSMVCEEIAHGRQFTANGFARQGKVTMLGTVDSIMYPGTDQFQRFQYPSSLPAGELARIDALATRLIEGMEFTHGMFNVEMRIDPHTGALGIIEINPRAAGQFYDLFERVDGYSLFEALLALDCGEEPVVLRRQGRQRHAASFVLRDLTGEGLSRWPSSAEIEGLQARHPDARVMIYRKRGADLAREMKWLGSYRYGVFNLGGTTLEDMFGQFHRLCAHITFHPHGHRVPDVEMLLAGDD
ncbi:MAG TPA: ATP-grasp domain-containing protein [Usitatibacter sp.]